MRISVFIALSFTLAACTATGKSGKEKSGPAATTSNKPATPVVAAKSPPKPATPAAAKVSNKPATPAPPRKTITTSPARMKAMATGINAMGRRILGTLFAAAQKRGEGTTRAATKNPMVSPWSMGSAFALAWLGAKGKTAKEFSAFFSSTLADPGQHEALGALQQDLQQVKGLQLSMANSLWLETTLPVLPGYLKDTADWYGAQPYRVDFIGAREKARLRINGWIAQKTNNRIKDLIPRGILTVDTRAVLVNAIWFLAKWATPFEKHDTWDQPFFTTPSTQVTVPTMSRRGQIHMARGKARGEVLVGLPYKGGRFTFYAYLPPAGKAPALPKAADLENMVGRAFISSLRLYLPKFTLRHKEMLGKMISRWMPLTFSNLADFSRITTAKPGIKISQVIHEVFVKVDEKGTEAAAATAILMEKSGMAPRPVPEVKFNRPFYFFIRDTKTGLDLFTGWVLNPAMK